MKVIDLNNKCDLKDVINIKNNETLDLPPVQKNTKSSNFEIDLANLMKPREQILSPEDIKIKRKLIIHIKNYIREFPTCLSEFSKIDLSKKSIHELENYLEEIKLIVCQSNSGGVLVGVFHGTCDVIESVAPIINCDLTGLKYIASSNPNILNSVKELSLEYQNLNYIPPEKRLAMLMLQMCYALNTVNKTNKKIEKNLNCSVSENIIQKYDDL